MWPRMTHPGFVSRYGIVDLKWYQDTNHLNSIALLQVFLLCGMSLEYGTVVSCLQRNNSNTLPHLLAEKHAT